MSVAVVKMTLLPMAGSIFRCFSTSGVRAPMNPATIRLSIIAIAITDAKVNELNQKYVIVPMSKANSIQFANDIINSFLITLRASFFSISPSASCLTVTARV